MPAKAERGYSDPDVQHEGIDVNVTALFTFGNEYICMGNQTHAHREEAAKQITFPVSSDAVFESSRSPGPATAVLFESRHSFQSRPHWQLAVSCLRVLGVNQTGQTPPDENNLELMESYSPILLAI